MDSESSLDQEAQQGQYDSSSDEALSDDETETSPALEQAPRTWKVEGRKSKKQALSERMSALIQARWAKARSGRGERDGWSARRSRRLTPLRSQFFSSERACRS